MLLLSGPVDLATCFGVKLLKLSFPGPPSAQYLAQLTEASESVDRKVVQVFEMGFPSSRSFTALANLHLPSSHVLHPDACNPAMDLVVLLGQTEESASTAAVSHLRQNGHSSKGKGKAEAAGYTTKIALWRMSGSRAWEVEVEGRVAGLAWSPDGTMLAKSPDHLLTDTRRNTPLVTCLQVSFFAFNIPRRQRELASQLGNTRASFRAQRLGRPVTALSTIAR